MKKSNLEYYLKLNPNIKKMRIVRMVNQMGFCKRNKKKVNVVAFQLKTQSAIALGKVEGDYEFKEITPTIKHIRLVKWLTMILSSQLDQDLLFSLGALLLFVRLKEMM